MLCNMLCNRPLVAKAGTNSTACDISKFCWFRVDEINDEQKYEDFEHIGAFYPGFLVT